MSSKGKENVLYNFGGIPDGANPCAGLIMDAKGNLYGTTENGGGVGLGVVFKVSSKGKETVLYSFPGGTDGGNPCAGLIMDAKGNLYGTTSAGGASSWGVVFKLAPSGNRGWKETVLYSFTGGTDGGGPRAALIMDAKGNLYGTTAFGGASANGVVFKVNSQGEESVLYSFTGEPDGANPSSALIMDAKGNLYGTTENGGASNDGTVFKLTP